MKLYFVRHGKTLGNTQGRYVGRTDEPLLKESELELQCLSFPPVELVAASPMLRCRQTAACLYPNARLRVYEDLREMDFGEFEYKNYSELKHNPAYQAYIDSGGTSEFPGAESLDRFRERCSCAFLEAVGEAEAEGTKSMAFVVHGGTIMAVLEAFGQPKKGYFDWQIKNGERIEGEWDGRGKIYIGL